jgi:hypothetical protein
MWDDIEVLETELLAKAVMSFIMKGIMGIKMLQVIRTGAPLLKGG